MNLLKDIVFFCEGSIFINRTGWEYFNNMPQWYRSYIPGVTSFGFSLIQRSMVICVK